MNPLEQAITFMGSASALARSLHVHPMTVCQWRKRRVPAGRCLAIERVTNGTISRHDLRPDVFGPAPK